MSLHYFYVSISILNMLIFQGSQNSNLWSKLEVWKMVKSFANGFESVQYQIVRASVRNQVTSGLHRVVQKSYTYIYVYIFIYI